MHYFKHLHTINKHRRLVRKYCFRLGLYWQGLTHDLSKYSWTEFSVGAKYYQGTRSPNAAERIEKGYSASWMHHKGRNKHHYEFWTDYSLVTHNMSEPVKMPFKYVAESVADRIAASRVYRGKDYKDGDAYDYFASRDNKAFMHPDTYEELDTLLKMLRDKGERETIEYIRELLKNDKKN